MALEEVLRAVDAVGHADHRARPALHMGQHPIADRLVELRQLQLGHRLAVIAVGPERLIGVADGDPHHRDRSAGHHGLGPHRHRPRLAQLRRRRRSRRLGLDILRRLVLAQALEGSLADRAVAGEAGVLDLRHQFGPNPVYPGGLFRGALPLERAFLGLQRFQSRHDLGHHLAPEARADPADMDQLAVTVHPGDQRAEVLSGRRPPADDHLVALPALRLAPAFAAARLVGRIKPLGDDAFQVHATGRQQHGVASCDEMIDVADVGGRVVDVSLQARLAVDQRERADVFLAVKHLVEDEEHQVLGPGV